MRYFGRWASVGLVTMLVLLSASAWAEEEQMPDRFMLRFGGYKVQGAESIVRLDANNLPVGTYIDFQQTLGGTTRSTVARLDGLYRFSEKHAIGASWYALRFSGTKVLEQNFEWNGKPYTIGMQVDSKLNYDVYKLNYQYSVFHNNEVELGASFGFHIMKTMVSIASSTILQSGSEAVTAPLPVWGLYASYNFTPRFSAFYNYQFFFINYEDKVKGGLQDFLFGLEYRLFRNVALGLAYNRFSLQMEAKQDLSTLYLNTNWSGGMLYGSVYF